MRKPAVWLVIFFLVGMLAGSIVEKMEKKALTLRLLNRIDDLEAQLTAARTNPGAQLLANSGHVMNEAQCRAWLGVMDSGQH